MSAFANYITKKLKEKQKLNPSYSLRSFARDLEIDASSLSKFASGKRIPDIVTVNEILDTLNEHQDVKESLCQRIEQEKNIKDFKLANPKKEFVQTPELVFKVISDPAHYTFLELIKLNDGLLDEDYYNAKLGTTPSRLFEVINNLTQVGLIKIENGQVKDLTSGFSSHEISLEDTNKANMNYQKILLERSRESISEVEMSKRDHSAILFATSHKKVFEAKGIIKKFRQSLCEFLEDTEEKDSVYALQVGLFPLTKERD